MRRGHVGVGGAHLGLRFFRLRRVNVLSGDVGELGKHPAWKRSAACKVQPAEVTRGDVQELEVQTCVRMSGIVYGEVEEDE